MRTASEASYDMPKAYEACYDMATASEARHAMARYAMPTASEARHAMPDERFEVIILIDEYNILLPAATVIVAHANPQSAVMRGRGR